ncbi:MAG: hypothetical protein ACQESR_13535 [Planctomycetota bacterium]
MESGPAQAVLPLVGLAAGKVIRDRSISSYLGDAVIYCCRIALNHLGGVSVRPHNKAMRMSHNPRGFGSESSVLLRAVEFMHEGANHEQNRRGTCPCVFHTPTSRTMCGPY